MKFSFIMKITIIIILPFKNFISLFFMLLINAKIMKKVINKIIIIMKIAMMEVDNLKNKENIEYQITTILFLFSLTQFNN